MNPVANKMNPRYRRGAPKRDSRRSHGGMIKTITVAALLLLLAGCAASTQQNLSTKPEATVKKVLPDGWMILRVEEDTYPSYRPEGNGKAIFLGLKNKTYLKQQYSAALFIMPPDYQDGGADPTGDRAQSWPAQLISMTSEAKIYLWPGAQADNWETMQQDLLKALTK